MSKRIHRSRSPYRNGVRHKSESKHSSKKYEEVPLTRHRDRRSQFSDKYTFDSTQFRSVRTSPGRNYQHSDRWNHDKFFDNEQSGNNLSYHNYRDRHRRTQEDDFMDQRRLERERIGLAGVTQVWGKSPPPYQE